MIYAAAAAIAVALYTWVWLYTRVVVGREATDPEDGWWDMATYETPECLRDEPPKEEG